MAARILVIEDNPSTRDLITYLLTAFGYAALSAADGVEGLMMAQHESPDLILCDIQLPRLDGYEIARQLKSDPSHRSIPLVAVTAFAMVGDREKVLSAGFDGYLTKPIDPELFIQQMEAFLPKGESSTALPVTTATPMAPRDRPTRESILVVDDLVVNIELARSTLEPSGYNILAASDVEEALAIAREHLPDLIISDIKLAKGTGFDLINASRADPKLERIPVVIITTSNRGIVNRRKALALGAATFLIRPIEPDVFLREIENVLRGSKLSET